ncbi:MAG: PorT family protein [Gemmatimonadota bacterium]|nr:MAG: PorT family protein [Gemmatimonadota bacterium]
MKRLTLLAFAAALLITAAPAQAQQLRFGVRGGLNFASADAEGDLFIEGTGSETAYHFGVLGAVDISSWFALQTEVWYSRKGFAEGDGGVALKLTYIEIPVLAVIAPNLPLSPRFFSGPVLGLESSCEVTFEGETEKCEDARPGAPRTKGADSGIIFGAGIGFDFGPGSLLADIWYNYGLTDISEQSDEIDSVKTRTWSISAGYVVPLGS